MHETKEKPHKADQHAQNQPDMKTTPQKIHMQPNKKKVTICQVQPPRFVRYIGKKRHYNRNYLEFILFLSMMGNGPTEAHSGPIAN